MRSDIWMRAGAALVISFLVWDNWQVRQELEQLRSAQPVGVAGSSVAASQPPTTPGTTVGCPVPGTTVAPNPTAKALEIPASPQGSNGSGSAPVQIPPTADLAEALRIIQREQAKNNPGSAGVSPFGGTQ